MKHLTTETKLLMGIIAFMIYFVVAIMGFESAKAVESLAERIGVITATVQRQSVPTLPQKCRQYYNDGTERWVNCMGVGYVREEDHEHD